MKGRVALCSLGLREDFFDVFFFSHPHEQTSQKEIKADARHTWGSRDQLTK